jgi:hypothetical protein
MSQVFTISNHENKCVFLSAHFLIIDLQVEWVILVPVTPLPSKDLQTLKPFCHLTKIVFVYEGLVDAFLNVD